MTKAFAMGRGQENRHIRRQLLTLGVVIVSGIVLGGCHREAPKVVETPPLSVTVAKPIVQEITNYDEYPGTISAYASVDIYARVSGFITKISFTDGQEVKAGAELFVIDPRPYQAEFDMQIATIETAKAKLKLAEQEFLRTQELFRTKSASAEQLDEATAKRDSAKGDLARAQSDLEQKKLYLDWTSVTAPFDGRMSNRLVNIGNLVNGSQGSATKLTSIVAEDPVYVYFDVDERSMQRYLDQVEQNQHRKPNLANVASLKIPVHFALASDTGFPHEGYLDFVDTQTNNKTGTVKSRAVFSNPDRLFIPGYFARVRIRSGPPHKGMLVSERAIGSELTLRYVYVAEKDGTVVLKPLTLGRETEGMREVLSGLSADDNVIVDNIQMLRPGEKVKATEGEMPRLPASIPGTPIPVIPPTNQQQAKSGESKPSEVTPKESEKRATETKTP
ncbi:efflux RND transporter periplasmic adaptor subunit [bacterium]|nr:efflux RND transporter periplasmic adaptor subunit [bacterium]